MKKFTARFDDGRMIKSNSMRRLNNMVSKRLLNEDISEVTFEAVELDARKTYNISDIVPDDSIFIGSNKIIKRLCLAEYLANKGR